MIELIAFAAFVLGLVAFLNGRKTAERLDQEIEALKVELKRVEARGETPKAALDEVPALAAAEASSGEPAAPVSAETSDPASQLPSRTLDSAARRGAAIFGGDTPSLSQEAVEKASRGEPVAARCRRHGVDRFGRCSSQGKP